MIIQCPACATRYVVPDSAIGADGRTVRCAKCRHSWYQEGPQATDEPPPTPPPPPSAPPPPPPAPPPPETERPETPADVAPDAPVVDPAPPPPEEEPFVGEPPLGEEPVVAPSQVDEEPGDAGQHTAGSSQFDREPPFRRRRNPLKLWTWAAVIFALMAAGTIFAVSYWGLPSWVPVARPIFAAAQPDLQLDFPPDKQIKRKLPNGSEYFGVSGTITNIGKTTCAVPSILIVLRDARDRIVYSWEVIPPKRSLGPGESEAVNEAVTEVPRSARVAEIGWKPA